MPISQTITANLYLVANFLDSHPYIIAVLTVWELVWKGFAVWKAARLSHRTWFIILLIANTGGILQIIYIFLVARKYKVVSEIEG